VAGVESEADGAYAPIADYGLIGAGRSAALVSRDGSIDWLCAPRFDSASIFNRLLDHWRGGYLSLRARDVVGAQRRYLGDTVVLETMIRAHGGTARVRDFMPALSEKEKRGRLLPYWSLIRVIDGLDGSVAFDVAFKPRPGDGREACKVSPRGRAVVCEAHGGLFRVDAETDWSITGGEARGELVVSARDTASVWLSYSPGPAVEPALAEARVLLDLTTAYWRDWSAQSSYRGPEAAAVRRSALTLKLLSYAPSGAIIAAPTMSLPERVGGVRNWDYRYCWLRDAAYAAGAFYRVGYREEAHSFVQWLMYATTLTHPELRVFYDVFGRPTKDETELRLDGYRGSRPVRLGNAARGQYQLDVYGEVMESLVLYHEAGGKVDRSMRKLFAGIGDYVAAHWDLPDQGIWEARAQPRHYVHSKILCWHALELACGLSRALGLDECGRRWRSSADALRDTVLTAGWSPAMNSFRQSFGAEAVDAALLLLPATGLLPEGDPRIAGTIAAVRRRLGAGDGLLWRYMTDDGLPPGEGAFLPCSFWLVESLALSGRRVEAEKLFSSLVARSSELGLLSEEIDVDTGELIGNYPQALTHMALINAGCALAGTRLRR
jgi:GH15 family glucan-1,4-alpha-glucosidase